MNRVILFRAKQVNDSKWIYGYYVHDNQISMKSFIHLLNKQSRVEVIHATVGQSTGVDATDGFSKKPQKTIYEGDTVQLHWCEDMGIKSDYAGTVVFLEGCWMVDTGTDALLLWSDAYTWRITGNIHDVEPVESEK